MNRHHGPLHAEQKLIDDPWSLAPAERLDLLEQLSDAQDAWLSAITALVEPPLPTGSFPAFLLATPPFERLRAAIAGARTVQDLDTATADELQRFVDCYRDYLVNGSDDFDATKRQP